MDFRFTGFRLPVISPLAYILPTYSIYTKQDNEMNYTNEEFEVLKRNEQHLSSAHRAWWVRNLPREEAEALREIDLVRDGANEPFSFSCGTCVLRMCRRLAPAYFADKEEREQVVETPTPKKVTRKRVKVEA